MIMVILTTIIKHLLYFFEYSKSSSSSHKYRLLLLHFSMGIFLFCFQKVQLLQGKFDLDLEKLFGYFNFDHEQYSIDHNQLNNVETKKKLDHYTLVLFVSIEIEFSVFKMSRETTTWFVI